MKFLLFLTAFVGMALTEDLKCYSCKDTNQNYVPCGEVREKLELCDIPFCTNMQIINENKQTQVWKGCGDFGLTDDLGNIFPINTFWGLITTFVNLNQCIDLGSIKTLQSLWNPWIKQGGDISIGQRQLSWGNNFCPYEPNVFSCA